jgi:site-specific recombinase XerC
MTVFPATDPRYGGVLAARQVPRAQWRNDHKWVRFYRYFCQKDRHPPADSKSLQLCIGRLASKDQTAAQRAQAQCAVESDVVCLAPEVRSVRDDDNFDVDTGRLSVPFGKGGNSRTVPLPTKIHGAIRRLFEQVRELHQVDLKQGDDGVFLPASSDQQATSAARALVWQWCFPAQRLTHVEATRDVRRSHMHETAIQRAIKAVARQAGIPKRVYPPTLRHTCATQLLQAHDDIRQIQQMLGHSDVCTPMSDTHTITSDLKP